MDPVCEAGSGGGLKPKHYRKSSCFLYGIGHTWSHGAESRPSCWPGLSSLLEYTAVFVNGTLVL